MPRRAGRQVVAGQYHDAAMDILATDGAAGLKIGPLCRALGVTSGSFYHHFGSWSGFVRALLAYWESEQTDRVVRLAAATDDPVERIVLVKRLTIALRHECDAAVRAWAAIDREVGDAQRRVDAQRREALAHVLGGVVADPADAHRLAVLGVSVLAGFQQTCDPRDRDLLGALLDDFQSLVAAHAGEHLRGLLSPPVG